jgi:hypothetical protein
MPEETVISAIHRYYGIEPTSESEAILHTLLHSFSIYGQRSQQYGSAWRRFGALNNLVRAAAKVERLLEQFWYRGINEGHDFDDAYDAINYLVFFLMQAGTGQWRSDR